MQEVQNKKEKPEAKAELPPIPDKVYFTIGEVSKLCDLKPHVLRYWEQEFPQLKPVRRGNRRYYQRKDVILIRQIRNLLYSKGFTIEGARAKLSQPEERENVAQRAYHSLKLAINDIENIVAELEEV